MKIRVAQIRDSVSHDIKGDEKWLASLYESFAIARDGTRRDKCPTMAAKIRLEVIPGDVIKVSGNVKFAPPISCGRCGDDIIWPVDSNFEVYYEKDFPIDPEQREVDLKPGELDRYYVENGTIDIESLLNEIVHLDIPLSNIRASEDGSSCLVCHADLSDPVVYEEEGQTRTESPFKVLASRNLKH